MIDPQAVTRPPLRYMGGKWRLAPWVVPHFPPHRIYVEPYAGGASVLLRKPRSYAEVYNDLDGEVVNLFRILRDPGLAARLTRAVALTPFAREEFDEAHTESHDTIERARRLIIRSQMSHGSTSATVWSQRRSGFRAASNRNGTTPAHDLGEPPGRDPGDYPSTPGPGDREPPGPGRDPTLRRAGHAVLCRSPVLARNQVAEARRGATRAQLRPRDDHRAAHRAHPSAASRPGMVVLSGYPSRLYDTLLRKWERAERQHYADGARSRQEVLWMNPAATRAHGLLGGMMPDV